jgi:hypothetical protein
VASAKLVGVIETETDKLALVEHSGRTDKLRKGDTLTLGTPPGSHWRVIWITAQSAHLEAVRATAGDAAPVRATLKLGQEARVR